MQKSVYAFLRLVRTTRRRLVGITPLFTFNISFARCFQLFFILSVFSLGIQSFFTQLVSYSRDLTFLHASGRAVHDRVKHHYHQRPLSPSLADPSISQNRRHGPCHVSSTSKGLGRHKPLRLSFIKGMPSHGFLSLSSLHLSTSPIIISTRREGSTLQDDKIHLYKTLILFRVPSITIWPSSSSSSSSWTTNFQFSSSI